MFVWGSVTPYKAFTTSSSREGIQVIASKGLGRLPRRTLSCGAATSPGWKHTRPLTGMLGRAIRASRAFQMLFNRIFIWS